MRLWHEFLIPYLPNKQLLGQHRECCALRGNGWGRKHSTVDYVFLYPYEVLYEYHIRVINEMKNRGYKVDSNWLDCSYRGKSCEKKENILKIKIEQLCYEEHNNKYLVECISNLKMKNAFPYKLENWENVKIEIDLNQKNSLI